MLIGSIPDNRNSLELSNRCTKDKDGKIIVDLQNKSKRWTEYINELFEDDINNFSKVNFETELEILKR